MGKEVLFFLLIIFISGFVSADFTKGNPSHSITTNYSLGSLLKGWINISLDEESRDSVFQTSEGDQISLIDLITLSEAKGNVNYDCNPLDCSSAYKSVGEGEILKTLELTDGESKVVGLRFGGDSGFEIPNTGSEISIDINSDAPESTFEQLFIDILDDGSFEWQSYQSSGKFYNEDYGCFDSSAQTTALSITDLTFYCERVNIPIAPEVEIGANVISINNPPVSATFKFIIKDVATETKSANCDVTISTEGRIGCIPQDFKIDKQEDYYVCIEAKESADNNKYKINSETSGNICGYSTSKNFQKDFDIFAKSGKFKSVGTFTLDDEEISNYGSGAVLKDEINGYITENYGGDCTEECVVPIRFISGKNQQQSIIISNVNIEYLMGGAPYTHPSINGDFEIYDVTKTPATISSGFVQLHLDDAEFKVPEKFGGKEFSLNLDGTKVFSESISVVPVPQIISLKPTIIAAAMPTEFFVNVKTAGNTTRITKYQWDFGGNNTQTTTKNSAVYTFDKIGTYDITITITDSSGKTSSKIFSIEVVTPKNAVNMLLKRNINSINSIKSTLENLTLLEQNSLSSILAFDETEEIISDLQQANASAVSDKDYISIMADLVSLSLPDSVGITKNIESLPFFPNEESVNLEILKSAGGGDFSDEEKYANAVISWNLINSQTKINSREFTAVYKNHEEELMNFFGLRISGNSEIKGAYLIMPEFENLAFAEDYGEEIENGFVSIQLDGEETIGFVTTEDIEFSELPAFISPPLNRLSIQRKPILNTEVISTFTLIILIVLLVGFLGFIFYIIMQQWYKRKYENHLFKNRNDLFNIVSYVHNMKKQGIEDRKVSLGLKKAGWNSEQVNYIMKKYYGKRTGMFEIPLLELFKLTKHPKTFFKGPNAKNQNTGLQPRKFNKPV